ncbi:helix-turn-helix domain-containing protein [Streptomyces sp. NPDC090080]|uniref:helix-turn-helix domain-containing protein n=1 Tax=Streptomyces sp. NPDC090080 TaxID=3365939 RepID=UPI00381F5368
MIGKQLRELRRQNNLSLRALAEQSGLSPTLISQIERGVTNPSLNTLRRLAEILGEPVANLLDDSTTPRVVLSRPGDRYTITAPGGLIHYEQLTPNNARTKLLRAVMAPGDVSSTEGRSHSSLECVYVLRGELAVQVGVAEHLVVAGEAITFDSRQRHRYLNRSALAVEFVLSVDPLA